MYFDDEYMAADEWYRQVETQNQTVCPFVYIMPYMSPFTDLDDDDDFDDDMRQGANETARLLRMFEAQSPGVLAQLEGYKIPRFFIRRIFRQVIRFVLVNVNPAKPIPQPINQFSSNLYEKLNRTQPWIANAFKPFKVPENIIRNIILNLIRFVIRNLSLPGGGDIESTVNSIVRRIETSTSVFSELARYKMFQMEARRLVGEIARFVLLNVSTAQGSIEQKANELTNGVIQRTDVLGRMLSKGIPQAQARSIIRAVVVNAIKELIPREEEE